MISFCSKCNINWSRLETIDGEGDEQYEVCPLCRSDVHLQEPTDFITYFRCGITGKVLNTDTKEELEKECPPLPPRKQYKKKPVESVEEREERELKAIDAYHKSGNAEDYFNTIKKTI